MRHRFSHRCLAAMPLLGALAALVSAPVAALGVLENPAANSSNSGIAAISGWHCSARLVEIVIDNQTAIPAASGTTRFDTASICGRTDTGFSLLYNFNLLPTDCFDCRTHRIRAVGDGVTFWDATFQVENFGTEFLTGAVGTYRLRNFPRLGADAWVKWDESKQNFALDIATQQVSVVDGTYLGAVQVGSQAPTCGPYPVDRVLPVKYGKFVIKQTDRRLVLDVAYADGGSCHLPESADESADSRTQDGYVHVVFDAAATAACPELPGGLDLKVNGERFAAFSLDNCRTGTAVGTR